MPWVLLKRTAHASASVAWILTVLFLPFLGALLCLLVGTTRWERQTGRKRLATSHIDERVPGWTDSHLAADDELGDWQPLARLVSSIQ